MKSFKEYIELKEDIKIEQEMLNEDPITIAAAILGYGLSGLAVGWGGALIIQGYAKLASKSVNGIRNAFRKITGKNKPVSEINNAIKDIKVDSKVRIQKDKQDEERSKYLSELGETFKAIEEKDVNATKESIKNVKLDQKIINRMIIVEATKVFGAPPLHYGTTGNETYLFIKKILGMKAAQAASFVVKKAFKKLGTELVKDIE